MSRSPKSPQKSHSLGLFKRPFEAFPKISQDIWNRKYRQKNPDGTPADATIDDTWKRVAKHVAKAEASSQQARWQRKFYKAMQSFEFLPAGRIMAGAGTQRDVTLFNCFVMDKIEDDMTSIFDNLKEAGLTMQRGGGIGHDFSTLRPRGAFVKGVGAEASGPVHFMELWNTMCQTIMSAGARRGAMMATMRCDHPDIEEFISAKSEPGRLTNFNLSVLVTDAFIAAVRNNADWPLVFDGKTYSTVNARDLWDKITRATYDYAEPGVVFIDRINATNNLHYCETINATNPCGEQPLPPHGACLLGSINLASLVRGAFTESAHLDEKRLAKRVAVAIRFMDNVIDVSRYPLPEQKHEAKSKRRLGLGVTGLADALIMCGEVYGSDAAITITQSWLKILRNAAYEASCRLAKERGPFPLCDTKALAKTPNIRALPKKLRAKIARHGLRNGLVTSIAPTGTISLLAGNVSSGIEPVFDFAYDRRILEHNGSHSTQTVKDFALQAHEVYTGKLYDHTTTALPATFVSAQNLPPSAHVHMQAAAQEFIDSAISKTINCPRDIAFDEFQSIYMDAFDAGLKGCTTYRPNEVTGSVLTQIETVGDKPDNQAAQPAPSKQNKHPIETYSVSEKTVHSADHDIVYLSEPLARPGELVGKTYKLKWPGSSHAYYLTINDMLDTQGNPRPFEIFINSKNLEHYAWTVALTRMVSAVFRRGGDVSFVVEELQEVFDPTGGHWHDSKYVPSLIAAIGSIVEQHMRDTGFLKTQTAHTGNEPEQQVAAILQPSKVQQAPANIPVGVQRIDTQSPDAKTCPQCGERQFVRQGGCFVCRTCGYSKCS